jgi:ATP-dependent helicase HrpB
MPILALALARDAQTGLREDLRILVMSATLDGARVAKLLGDAPVVESERPRLSGRDPLCRPQGRRAVERQMAETIAVALRADAGSVLAFLPGAAEIRRTQTFLTERCARRFSGDRAAVRRARCRRAGPRHRASPEGHSQGGAGDLDRRDLADHRGACASWSIPAWRGCRATSPTWRLTRLETVRASRAAVDQRRGRAGRIEPGVCYRLWDEPQTASLPAYTAPEILSADLSSLVLDLAQWGVSDPSSLAFLDPPPGPALKEAKSLLAELGALDSDGRITEEGKSLRALALPPRLARMIVDSARFGYGGRSGRDRRRADRARARRRQRRSRRQARPVPPRPLAARLERAQHGRALGFAGVKAAVSEQKDLSTGVMLGFAFPDRVAKKPRQWQLRAGQRPRRCRRADRGAGAAVLPSLVAELTGTAASGRILLAAPITQEEIEQRFADQIENVEEVTFDRGAMALRARRRRSLHAITLSEAPMPLKPSAETARIFADGLIAAGLDRLPWCRSKRNNGATASCSCARPRTRAGPICRMLRSPRVPTTGWCLRCTTRSR